MGKTAIVIGATGVVGRELIGLLTNDNSFDKVISITRKEVAYQSTKICNEVVDFENLENSKHLFKGDVLYSALGTTLKQAGSIEAQRRVDLDYQLIVAKIAKEQGVTSYVLVSSSGANSKSKSSYLKMKGELEERVKLLSFERVTIVQPSLLIGTRSDFRLAEKVGVTILPVICKIPLLSKYRPITGLEVASAMIKLSQRPGKSIETYLLDELFV